MMLSNIREPSFFYRERSNLFVMADHQFILVLPFANGKKYLVPPLPKGINSGPPTLPLDKKNLVLSPSDGTHPPHIMK